MVTKISTPIMACKICLYLKNVEEADEESSELFFHHHAQCIQQAINSLATLFIANEQIEAYTKSLLVFGLCQHKLIRKNYIHQHKELFKSLLEVVTYPDVCKYDLSHITEMGELLPIVPSTIFVLRSASVFIAVKIHRVRLTFSFINANSV